MQVKNSAAKRHRQSEKRRMRNKSVKSRVRTSVHKLLELATTNADEEAQNQFQEVAGRLDRAVSKGVLHKNTAARKKHRLVKLLRRCKSERSQGE
ncbi:30S ribosomal protein S20 [subsurface metagenome]